jgi:solute carrier family 34 (sodium-dependent phosphate cotransporter)
VSDNPAAAPDASGPPTWLRAILVVALLYLFLVGVSLLEDGIAQLGEGFQDALLRSVDNPVAGVFAGLLATVLVQSSSVSTSTIVGMVGAGTLPVSLAVPMIMGANIGTTVTNTLASLGHARRGEEFRRAFAAATVHDWFNLIAVAIFLPIEILTGIFARTATEIGEFLFGGDLEGVQMQSPIKEAVDLPVHLIESAIGVFVRPGVPLGLLFIAAGLGCIFYALRNVTRNMRELIAGQIERAMNRVIEMGGGAGGILVGIVVTIAVQSSTITTVILVPMVAAGILTLRNAFPVTLGANLGTTVTALLASLAVQRPEGLVIALVHTLFNATAIAVVYPVAAIRRIPIRLAEWMGDMAIGRRATAAVYVGGLFLVVPLLVIALLR